MTCMYPSLNHIRAFQTLSYHASVEDQEVLRIKVITSRKHAHAIYSTVCLSARLFFFSCNRMKISFENIFNIFPENIDCGQVRPASTRRFYI